ncbi:MAG TPA: DCC1-like thiol-disulfide oxidoreductase family protein [Myxococcota bacterium]|nr:DCC1-like thiol-disulfide oxidoreductase family protein [Myxococcota bacterium]
MDLPDRLILFDGACVVCDAGMTWILDRDPDGRFSYAPLQGPTAAAIVARHPELPAGLDSIVYVRRAAAGEVVSWHSAAILQIAADLPAPWRWLRWLWVVPRPVRDWGYRAFAAARYRLFGRLEACRLPREGEAERFFD